MNGRVGAVACAVMMGVASRLSTAQKPSGKADDDVSALPLHTVAAKTSPALALAVMLTGDGGWARLDRRIADDLAAHGVSVVGLDSRAYLMQERTPDEAAADIARVIRRYVALIPYDHAWLIACWKPRMNSSWKTIFRSFATAVRKSSGAGTLFDLFTGPICWPRMGNR